MGVEQHLHGSNPTAPRQEIQANSFSQQELAGFTAGDGYFGLGVWRYDGAFVHEPFHSD